MPAIKDTPQEAPVSLAADALRKSHAPVSQALNMAKLLKLTAAFFLAGTVILFLWHQSYPNDVLLSLTITFGTIAYHFIMRLLVGLVFRTAMHNRADYRKRWYQVSKRKLAIYEKLRVKKWKSKMPTYDPTLFDPQIRSWDEIAQVMYQAELVHETFVVFSFLPIVGGIWFGAYPVFIATSILAAWLDTMFVIMLRYNRQRVLRFLNRKSTMR